MTIRARGHVLRLEQGIVFLQHRAASPSAQSAPTLDEVRALFAATTQWREIVRQGGDLTMRRAAIKELEKADAALDAAIVRLCSSSGAPSPSDDTARLDEDVDLREEIAIALSIHRSTRGGVWLPYQTVEKIASRLASPVSPKDTTGGTK